MSNYIDVYLLPMPKKNVPAYKKMAQAASKVFIKHGALTYYEYVESDLKVMPGISSFTKLVKPKKGEVIVYAHVTFKSEAQRNKTMKKIFADEDLANMMPGKPLFDMKRMVYGGFKVLVKG
jgi:uncharacterized protein YbaA (DUF1428 family)